MPGIDTLTETLEQTTTPTPTNVDFDPLPDLRQFTSREALSFIKLLNVPYVVVSVYDDTPLGTVLEQSPAAGAAPPEDSVVTLVVSRGPRPGATPASPTPSGTTPNSETPNSTPSSTPTDDSTNAETGG